MSLLFTQYVRSSIAGDVSRAIRRRICDPCRRFASSNVAGITLDPKPSGQTEVQSTTPSKTVLCVDYLPDRVTEDAVAKVFAPHVKVRNVQLGRTRLGIFLGRAYVSFNSPEDLQHALHLQAPLQCSGETLHVEPWPIPTVPTSALRVRNLPPRKVAKQELIDVFSPFGAVQDLWFNPKGQWCHVKFVSEDAAQSALVGAFENSLTLDGHKLEVQIALDPPNTILHLMGITGGEQQVLELLKDYKDNIKSARPGKYASTVALVEFDTVDNAIRAKYDMIARGIRTKFSRRAQITPDTWTPPADAEDDPSQPNVLHISNIPLQESASAISKRFVLKSGRPFAIRVMDTEGHFTGRALVIFVTAADAAYIQRRHLFKPFLYDGVPLILTRSQAPRVSRRTSPTRVVMVHDAPKSTLKNDLWRIMSQHGKVEWISQKRVGSYVIKFHDIEAAVRAVEAHCLKPYHIEGQPLKLHFTHNSET